MENATVSGFRHIGVIVEDMDASLHFYRDMLGLEVIQDFTDNSDYINTITGIHDADVHMIKLKTQDGIVLEILEYRNHKTELLKHPIYNAGICHIAFRVENADETHKLLVQNNVKVISKPVLSSEKIAKVFFCFDPNNVRIEIVEMLEKQLQ